MPEQWIIRVDGKEYGPADLSTLREWKAEGRVLPANDARRADAATWKKASGIPGLFQTEAPPLQTSPPELRTRISTKGLLPQTFTIYAQGFFKYVGLTLLVLGPSLLAQLTGAWVDTRSGAHVDTGSLLAAAFAVCMLLLGVMLFPVYIAGIQILTASFAAGERVSLPAVLNEAVKYWPRVAFLWLFVILCYAFWTAMPVLLILTIALSGLSVLSISFILLLLTLMVWMTGRLFINFMFWQQFAVLEGCNAIEALRRSRELARSRSDLPWFRRPLWRGVFIASLWFALVLALNWPTVSHFFRTVLTTTDPQMLLETFKTGAKTSDQTGFAFAANLLQAILKPLLGIAFVLLFLHSNGEGRPE
jgi:GYF domain 2